MQDEDAFVAPGLEFPEFLESDTEFLRLPPLVQLEMGGKPF
jgi:hypothetical protein